MSSRINEIASRLNEVRSSIPAHVHLIVVTKNFPTTDIEILYDLGEREFGENRVQELIAKRDSLPREINESVTWHFQGQIQSNKVASLNRYADVIHSIDSMKVAEKILPEKKVFLQINLDPIFESERGGIRVEEIEGFSAALKDRFAQNFLGVMGVAPHSSQIELQTEVQGEVDPGKDDASAAFKRLKGYSRDVMKIAPEARYISAGMSDDFRKAIEEGATHIRLGSSILGQRLPRA